MIEGHRSLKQTEKKKPTDVIWQSFYVKARHQRAQYKKHESALITPHNTVEYYRVSVFEPPFSEPYFSYEESKGKHVDLHEVYNFLNLCKVL